MASSEVLPPMQVTVKAKNVEESIARMAGMWAFEHWTTCARAMLSKAREPLLHNVTNRTNDDTVHHQGSSRGHLTRNLP